MFFSVSRTMSFQPRILTSGALLALALCASSAPVLAHSNDSGGPGNPGDRVCALLSMLGQTPPQCLEQSEEISPEVRAQLDKLFLSVLPFFSFDVAVAAGWDTIPGGECVESPMGGMGYHLQNIDELTNGHLSLLRPEALLYAPTEDGSLEFVGVEFIIPGDLWTEPDPPVFLEQPLHFNPHVGPAGIWALHVWVVEENPDGMFADWNPEVSCQFAPEE